MIFIKCILLIALLNYSTSTTVKSPVICSFDQICVNYQHCDNGTINIHGNFLIGPRLDKECSGKYEVCCVFPATTIPTATTTVKTPVICNFDQVCVNYQHCDDGTLNESGNNLVDLRPVLLCSHYLEVCCAFSNVTEIPIDIAVNNKIATKCGVSNPNGVGMKIKEIVDREAQFGEFPWMVVVLKKEVLLDDISSVYHCGGSLIHPSVVLTAGHKVVGENPKDLIVRAGEWDTRTKSEHLATVESNVASLVVHEKFVRKTLIYNIALLFLETPIQNDKHINTICLPQPNVNFDGARCFATGWGKHKFGETGKYQEILKKIDLPVIERYRCTEMFSKTRLGRIFKLHKSLICAGGEEGIDTCTGDGGSPLVCPVPGNEGYFYQAGIVSWGIECGGKNIPGAYTNVAFFADWIENEMQYKGYNSRSYTL